METVLELELLIKQLQRRVAELKARLVLSELPLGDNT